MNVESVDTFTILSGGIARKKDNHKEHKEDTKDTKYVQSSQRIIKILLFFQKIREICTNS